MKTFLLSSVLVAVPVALAAQPPRPFDTPTETASVIPKDALIYVEAPGFSELCSQGLTHPLIARLLASPLGELLQQQTKVPPALALGMANMYVGRPILPALSELTSKGLALGIHPGVIENDSDSNGQQIVSIVARGDADLWEEMIAVAMGKVAEAWGLPKDKIVPPHRQIRGVDVWKLGESGAFGLKGGTFLASNDETTLRRMIDLGAADEPLGLAAEERFHRARSVERNDAGLLWAWLDIDGIEAAGLGDGDGLENLRGIAGQPAPQFLLGPALSSLGSAGQGIVELSVRGESIEISIRGLEIAAGVAREVLQPVTIAAPKLPAPVVDEAARGVFYRDLAGLFRHRVDLFPSDAQPGFAEATSNLALFFEGADITDEVLPSLEPWIGFVAREPSFSSRAVPDLPLPAAALLLRVKDPEVMGRRLISAFQTFVTIINVEAAQNQQPALTLDLELHEGLTISYARFRAPASGEGVDMRYNLVPACTLVGDTFVLGSHVSLVKELATQLIAGDLEPAPIAGDAIAVAGDQLAGVVRANREALVMNAILNEGKDEEVANTEINALIAITGLIEELSIAATRPAEDEVLVALHLEIAQETE